MYDKGLLNQVPLYNNHLQKPYLPFKKSCYIFAVELLRVPSLSTMAIRIKPLSPANYHLPPPLSLPPSLSYEGSENCHRRSFSQSSYLLTLSLVTAVRAVTVAITLPRLEDAHTPRGAHEFVFFAHNLEKMKINI